MIPPPRLRETSPSFSRMLATLRDEEPAPELVDKVLALPDRSPAPTSRGSGRVSPFARWLVVSAATLAVMGIGWKLHEARRPPIAGSSSAIAAKVESPPPAPEPSITSAVSVDDLPAAAPPPTIAPAGRTPPTPKQSASASNDETSTFHEELALVEAARAGLARGDAQSCLQTLDRYDARFRGGVLTAEADITRIEAWASLGRHEKARALADQFLAHSPASPYAARVRAVRAKLDAAAAPEAPAQEQPR